MQIFEISPGLFIWSAITFLVLVGMLYKFAFNPLMRLQKKRQDEIHGAIHEAESLRDEAQELLANYKRQLAAARQEAEGILDRARKLGEASRAEVLEEARLQAEATLAKARRQIERDTALALETIRGEVADLTVAATERVARTSLSGEDQLKLIQQAINEIDLSKVSEN
ncbi:MAG: F0F1 ATP synthase subunit B [Actinobacteria bacterium]|nr:F0F1 ATP synthase subunit B [Actinomycetota bacterium]